MATVRIPAVAGMFYPADPVELRTMVQHLLAQAPSSVVASPCAAVLPHAGYIYSGYTAACGYRSLPRAPAATPRRVFLIGPSHRVYLEGVSVGDYRAFATPLGEIPLDEAVVARLAQEPDVSRDRQPHLQEHSLEVHLPFLQETVGAIRLVPMVYGRISGVRLAELIALCREPDDLVVISSDLSHFHGYEQAKQLDQRCHNALLAMDEAALTGCEACGITGMAAMVALGKRHHWRPTLVDYRNSGDTAGDKQRVVGYASYLFYPEPERGAQLVALARTHLERTLRGERGVDPAQLMAQDPGLAQAGACFVTLTAKGHLRGCIGSLVAHRPLAVDLLDNAVSAAVRDPRFHPLSHGELAGVRVEVSLLSPAKPLAYRDGNDLLQRLRPGVDGVILSVGPRRSTFLPQVWEQLPDPRQFLSHLCQKAGLAGDCWQHHPTIEIYTVEKFCEPDAH